MNFSAKLSNSTILRCDIVDLYYALYGVKRPQCLQNDEFASLFKPQKVKEPIPQHRDAVNLDLEDTLVLHKSPPRNEPDDFKSIEIIQDDESFVVDDLMHVHKEPFEILENEEELEIKMETEDYKVMDVIEMGTIEQATLSQGENVVLPTTSSEDPPAKRIKLENSPEMSSTHKKKVLRKKSVLY